MDRAEYFLTVKQESSPIAQETHVIFTGHMTSIVLFPIGIRNSCSTELLQRISIAKGGGFHPVGHSCQIRLYRCPGGWEAQVSPSTPRSHRPRLHQKAEDELVHIKQRWKRVDTTTKDSLESNGNGGFI